MINGSPERGVPEPPRIALLSPLTRRPSTAMSISIYIYIISAEYTFPPLYFHLYLFGSVLRLFHSPHPRLTLYSDISFFMNVFHELVRVCVAKCFPSLLLSVFVLSLSRLRRTTSLLPPCGGAVTCSRHWTE